MLVTGAAGGLGAALTAAFRARGDRVLATDRPGAGAELDLDVTSDDAWAAARAQVERTWGGLDILVNNAGVATGGRVDVELIEDWHRAVEVNLLGAVRGTRAFVPMMKAAGSGTIVNVASLAALVHPAGMGSYNATKAGLLAFTETIGHELAGHGITAHAVCPGYFRSGLINSVRGADRVLGSVIGELIANSPYGPDDIAAAVLAGLAAGDELILPDAAAQQTAALKRDDPTRYVQVMRHQAAALERAAHPDTQEEN